MKLSTATAIYTATFYQCVDRFFKGRKDDLYREIQEYLDTPTLLPPPQKCGNKKARNKILLGDNNAILQYWDYGRIWQVYGITEMDNEEQLNVLYELLERSKDD